MKVKALSQASFLLIYGLPAFIIFTSVCIAFSPLLILYPELAVGVTYDLALTTPLLYLFLIRKKEIPKITVLPIFFLGVTIASFIIPIEQQFHLSIIKNWIFPMVEVSVLGYIGFSVYKIVKIYKSNKHETPDVYTILRLTSQDLIEKIISPQLLINRFLLQTDRKELNIKWYANLIAFEAAIIYYGLFKWRKPKLTQNQFTYHKKSGFIVLLGVIIFIITAETIVLHVLIEQWSRVIAWVLTIPGLYFVLQLFAHTKAVYLRPIELTDDKLILRYGLFGEAEIDLDNIEEIKFSLIVPSGDYKVVQMSIVKGFEQFNTQIYLKEEISVSRLYGFKAKCNALLFFVDENKKLMNMIKHNEFN